MPAAQRSRGEYRRRWRGVSSTTIPVLQSAISSPVPPSKLRQHLCYVYASLSRLDFRGLPENGIVVFEGLTGFLAVKKPTALMMHWWNGGRGGVCLHQQHLESLSRNQEGEIEMYSWSGNSSLTAFHLKFIRSCSSPPPSRRVPEISHVPRRVAPAALCWGARDSPAPVRTISQAIWRRGAP